MADLTEFNGEDALRASIIKKRDKAQEKMDGYIAKANDKIQPLQAQIEKFDALIQVLDEGKAPVSMEITLQEYIDRAYVDVRIPVNDVDGLAEALANSPHKLPE